MTRVVLQAGGEGRALLPYTRILPKPLMPVAGRPVLEIMIRQLAGQGLTDITVTLGELAGLIRAVLGGGSQWGADVRCVSEPMPLGTIGPLRLVDDLDEPFLVMNGDVLTDLDYAEFLEEHVASGARLSVATTTKTIPLPLGVVELDAAGHVSDFRQEPTISLRCSMGIYAVNPEIVELVPPATPFGIDDLMDLCLRHGIDVRTHEHDGLWLDMGDGQDYETATALFLEHRDRLLPDRPAVAWVGGAPLEDLVSVQAA